MRNSEVLYVATIDTKYQVMAVAKTKDEAIRLASEKAHEYCHQLDGVGGWYYTYDDGMDPVEYFTEHFGVNVTRIKLGTAICE